jgi:hypothetical protein
MFGFFKKTYRPMSTYPDDWASAKVKSVANHSSSGSEVDCEKLPDIPNTHSKLELPCRFSTPMNIVSPPMKRHTN